MGRPASYYDILEIDHDASADEVKRAYYSKAKRLHPDVRGSTSTDLRAAFEQVQVAYEVLRDPKKRARHDRVRGIKRRFGSGGSSLGPSFKRTSRRARGGLLEGLIGGLLSVALQGVASFMGDLLLVLAPRRSRVPLPARARPLRDVRLYVEDNLPIYDGEHVRVCTPRHSDEVEVVVKTLGTALQIVPGASEVRLVALDFGTEHTQKLLVVLSAQSDPSFLPSSLALPEILTEVLIARIDSGPFFEEIVRRAIPVPLGKHGKPEAKVA